MIFILFCLINLAASASTDKCKAIKEKTKNNVNGYAKPPYIEDIKNSKKKSLIKKGKLTGGFEEAWIFEHEIDGKTQEVVAKKIRRTADNFHVGYQAVHDPEMVEDKMLYCEFDHQSLIQLKTVFRLSTECPYVDAPQFLEKITDPIVYKLVKNRLVGSIQSLRSSLSKLEQLELGPLGDIKFFRTDDGHNLLIRIIPRANPPMKDMYFTKIFNDETYGARYRGCYVDDDYIFLIQGAFYSHCDDHYFLENFRTLDMANRLAFMLKMANAVAAFNLLGYVHNDIQPSNFLLDSEREPHLVNFKYSALFLTDADPADQANPFMSPQRSYRDWVSDGYDLYSLAATFVALESFQGSQLYTVDPDTGLAREKETIPINDAERKDYMQRVLDKVIKPVWGVEIISSKKIVAENFGTALYKILLDPSTDFGFDQLIQLMKKEIVIRSKTGSAQNII